MLSSTSTKNITTNLDLNQFEFILQLESNTDKEFPNQFDPNKEDFLKNYTPKNKTWEDASNNYELAIKINKYTYSISQEMHGLQFVFSGTLDLNEAKDTMQGIIQNLEQGKGLKTKFIITGK